MTPSLLVGGAERWILDLLASVDRSRFVWMGVAKVNADQTDERVLRQVEASCPVLIGPEAPRTLAAACDVLIVWGVKDLAAYLPPRPRPCRVVLASHGVGDWTKAAMASAPDADALVAVSKAAVMPFPPSEQARVAVIPNGVDPRRVLPTIPRDAVRAGWPLAPEHRVIGSLGRLSFEKNPSALAYAIHDLPDPWMGVMVGGGWQAAQVEAISRAIAGDRVVFPGPTEDVGSALAAMDYFLLPSHEEACSIALIEAWLARVPVVATPVGLVPEVPDLVKLIPRGSDGPTIAVAVLDLEADPSGTAAMVERAYRYAMDHLTLDRFGRAWSEYLASVAAVPALAA